MTPNIEKLLEVNPDLILADPELHAEVYSDLEKIALVIALRETGDWTKLLREYAKVLGREEQAEKYIEETLAALADTNKKLASYQNDTFAFLRPSSKSDFGIVGFDGYEHYHDNNRGLGLKIPEGYPAGWELITLEGLTVMNMDHIFISDSEQGYADTWQSMPTRQYGSPSKQWLMIKCTSSIYRQIRPVHWRLI